MPERRVISDDAAADASALVNIDEGIAMIYNLLLQIAVGRVNLVVTCLAIELDRLAAAA